MTKEEAVKEIEKAFEPAFANYIITALTEGATVSDKEQGAPYIQAIYTEALEEGIRCAMCTNTIKSDTGCDGGCIVDAKMYNKVMTEINSRLLKQPPVTPQEPNTWSLDDAREDFMNDVYSELGFLPTNEEANRIIDIFDRVTSSIGQEPRWIPVTERMPEEGTFVLASYNSDEGTDVVMTYYNKYGFTRGLMTAWMPLPEPYKGGE